MKKILLGISAALLLLIGGYIGYQPSPTVASFEPVGGTTYRLQSSIGLANTSLTLSSFKSRSGIPWTMSLLNTDIVYATLDPQSTNTEFISFTGIVQNSDGTATISGITRGLSDFYPFTASSTMQRSHSGQSIFIISDSPQLFEEYGARRTDQNISGVWNFLSLPTSSVVCTNQFQFCNKAYIDAGLAAGAPAAGYVIPGIGIVSTGLQMASSTASTTYNAVAYPNFLSAENSTSTSNGVISALHAIITDNAGKIAQSFLDLTAAFTWSGANVFSNTVSIAASASFPLTLNGLAYNINGSRQASSTVLAENGSGSLSFMKVNRTYSMFTSSVSQNNGASTTMRTITLPTGVLTSASILRVTVQPFCSAGGTGEFGIDLGTGSATTSIAYAQANINIPAQIMGTISATTTVGQMSTFYGGQGAGAAFAVSVQGRVTPYSNAGNLYLGLVANGNTCGFGSATVEILQQ